MNNIFEPSVEDILNCALTDIFVTKTGNLYFYLKKDVLEKRNVDIRIIIVALTYVVQEAFCLKVDSVIQCFENQQFFVVSVSDDEIEKIEPQVESGCFLNENHIGLCAMFDSMRDVLDFSKIASPLLDPEDLSFLYSKNGKAAVVIYTSFDNAKLFSLLSEFSFDVSHIIPSWSLTMDSIKAIDTLALMES